MFYVLVTEEHSNVFHSVPPLETSRISWVDLCPGIAYCSCWVSHCPTPVTHGCRVWAWRLCLSVLGTPKWHLVMSYSLHANCLMCLTLLAMAGCTNFPTSFPVSPPPQLSIFWDLVLVSLVKFLLSSHPLFNFNLENISFILCIFLVCSSLYCSYNLTDILPIQSSARFLFYLLRIKWKQKHYLPHFLVSFCCCDKTWTKSNAGWKGFILFYTSKLLSIFEESQRQFKVWTWRQKPQRNTAYWLCHQLMIS